MTTRRGVTLIELLVTLTVLGVLAAIVGNTLLATDRVVAAQRDRMDSQDALRRAELVLSTVLRTARANPVSADSTLTALHPDPLGHGAFDNVRVLADINPSNGSVADLLEDVLLFVRSDTLYARWQRGGAAVPVAHPIRALRFEYFDAAGAPVTDGGRVDAAARTVRVTLQAPPPAPSAPPTEVRAWVLLRNHR